MILRDDPADTLGISRAEWPQKNARLVGLEDSAVRLT